MVVRRTAHTVYNLQYHFVFVPKYRRLIFLCEEASRLWELVHEIGERYEYTIEEIGVSENHVHIFLSAPPWYSPSGIANVIKSITAKHLGLEFSRIKHLLWGGEVWERGYYVGSCGDAVTADMIQRYVSYHRHEERGPIQLNLFE
jgi:putative transposase